MDENTWLFILIGSKKKSYDGVKKIREQRISINNTNFYVTTDRKWKCKRFAIFYPKHCLNYPNNFIWT